MNHGAATYFATMAVLLTIGAIWSFAEAAREHSYPRVFGHVAVGGLLTICAASCTYLALGFGL